MRAVATEAVRTTRGWVWGAFLNIFKRMVTSAVEIAWRLFVVTVLALAGISYASENPPSSPFDLPSEVVGGLREIAEGMRVLVSAAEKYNNE